MASEINVHFHTDAQRYRIRGIRYGKQGMKQNTTQHLFVQQRNTQLIINYLKKSKMRSEEMVLTIIHASNVFTMDRTESRERERDGKTQRWKERKRWVEYRQDSNLVSDKLLIA